MKAFDCIREASFINSHTLEDLAARFDASREPHAFLVTYFLTALAASLKEPDVMNQVCFQELLMRRRRRKRIMRTTSSCDSGTRREHKWRSWNTIRD